jgi:glutathione synthase/RimK-type ligase-like ATP-grasp enzyme
MLVRAHENKVFFEMLRHSAGSRELRQPRSWWYGSYEEFRASSAGLPYPVLIKRPDGSMSRGVSLAGSRGEAERVARRAMKTPCLRDLLRDTARRIRHRNYIKESWHRGKIVVQEFIPGLKNDYKVLVFGTKYYVLYRRVREGDFKASGQGLLEYRRELPDGLLDFATKCFAAFRAPNASFDIGFDGREYYLFEAQYVCFGTYTIENSSFYFSRSDGGWVCIEGKSCLEEEYAESLAWFFAR